MDDRDGIDESFEEDADDKKQALTVGGQVLGQTQLEKQQACKIVKLEAELDRIRALQVHTTSPPGFQLLPAGIQPPNVSQSVATGVAGDGGMPPTIVLPPATQSVPVAVTSANLVPARGPPVTAVAG